MDEGVVCYCEDVGSVGNVLGVGYEYLGSKEVILGSVCEVVVRVLQGGGFEGDGRRGFEEEVRKGVLRVSGVERCERVFLERVGDEGGVLKEGLEERARVLEIKEEEYRKSARGLKEIVRGTGITKDRTHGCLVMEMEKVEGLKKELGDLEDMLKAFEDLPPVCFFCLMFLFSQMIGFVVSMCSFVCLLTCFLICLFVVNRIYLLRVSRLNRLGKNPLAWINASVHPSQQSNSSLLGPQTLRSTFLYPYYRYEYDERD